MAEGEKNVSIHTHNIDIKDEGRACEGIRYGVWSEVFEGAQYHEIGLTCGPGGGKQQYRFGQCQEE